MLGLVASARMEAQTPVAPPKDSGGTPSPAPKPDAAAPLFEEKCSGCHAIDVVKGQNHSAQEWSDIVDRMIAHGLSVSDDERALITTYLGAHFGP